MELFFHHPWIPFWVIWSAILVARREHPVMALVLPPLYLASWVLRVVMALVHGCLVACAFYGLTRWIDWR